MDWQCVESCRIYVPKVVSIGDCRGYTQRCSGCSRHDWHNSTALAASSTQNLIQLWVQHGSTHCPAHGSMFHGGFESVLSCPCIVFVHQDTGLTPVTTLIRPFCGHPLHGPQGTHSMAPQGTHSSTKSRCCRWSPTPSLRPPLRPVSRASRTCAGASFRVWLGRRGCRRVPGSGHTEPEEVYWEPWGPRP